MMADDGGQNRPSIAVKEILKMTCTVRYLLETKYSKEISGLHSLEQNPWKIFCEGPLVEDIPSSGYPPAHLLERIYFKAYSGGDLLHNGYFRTFGGGDLLQ